MSEALYDEKVAPLLAEVANVCKELNLPFLALVEYAPDTRGETRVIMPAEGLAMTMARLVAHNGQNVDGLLIGLIRHCNREGIDLKSSMFLSMYATQPKDTPNV